MTEFHKKIIHEMKNLFADKQNILAAWEGGSAATGFLDDYSDLDLALITTDDTIEETFKIIESYLIENYGILHKFRMPEPNWHGHSQCFYLLEDSPEFFYVDLLIEKESAKKRFTESDRHGNAIIWFDKKNLIDLTPTPDDEIYEKCVRQFKLTKSLFPFLETDIKKQIKRGNAIDAISIYNGLFNRMAVLLNIKYRPHKFDFGLRYYYRDLPETEVKFVEEHIFIRNLDELRRKLPETIKKFKLLIEDLNTEFSH